MTDWPRLFEETHDVRPPATSADLAQLQDDLTRPLTESEIGHVIESQSNPWRVSDPFHATWRPLDPRTWQLPGVPLPHDYVNMLRWSDGPWIRNGVREFDFFRSSEVRELLLAYHLPYYMPGAIPLGLDGCGIFALLDTRGGPAASYPVLAAAAGVLDFADAVVLAGSFTEFCSGTTRIEDELYRSDPPDPSIERWSRPVDLVLVRNPEKLELLLLLRRHLSLDVPANRLLTMARDAPQVVLTGVPFGLYRRKLDALPPEASSCVVLRDAP